MSIAAYTDTATYQVLDDALERLAQQRDLSLTRDSGLLSALGSLALQINAMIEHAIAESDLGSDVTLDDIAGLLDISTAEALQRYAPTKQAF